MEVWACVCVYGQSVCVYGLSVCAYTSVSILQFKEICDSHGGYIVNLDATFNSLFPMLCTPSLPKEIDVYSFVDLQFDQIHGEFANIYDTK